MDSIIPMNWVISIFNKLYIDSRISIMHIIKTSFWILCRYCLNSISFQLISLYSSEKIIINDRKRVNDRGELRWQEKSYKCNLITISIISQTSASSTQRKLSSSFLMALVLSGTPQFLGQLDGKTDVSNLAGRSLILTERDYSKKSPHSILHKAASVGFRSRQGKLFSSASTDDSVEQQSADTKLTSGKHVKQKFQLSQLWGTKVRDVMWWQIDLCLNYALKYHS